MSGRAKPVSDRLLAQCSRAAGDGCWIFTGSTNGRYGVISVAGHKEYAHRASFWCFKHAIPAGMWVLHRCDEPLCINPAHLFLGTPADNTNDAHQKGRLRMWVDDRRPGEKNGRAVVTEAAVRDIRQRAKTQQQYASQYGISKGAVKHIQMRRSWKHIPV